jgi:hypothetical protein
MIKNNFFTRIFYLFEPDTPYRFFLAPPLVLRAALRPRLSIF